MIIHADDIAPTPWKNGGGVTRDLLSSDGGPGWRWRISLADITADGPFSDYPGLQRWFAVVEGAGVELRFRAGVTNVRLNDEPLHFDGATGPACRLLGGPTRDLNLLLRADQGVRGVMRRAVPGTEWAEDWPLRGRFATATRTLEWGLPAGALQADTPGFWIGIAP